MTCLVRGMVLVAFSAAMVVSAPAARAELECTIVIVQKIINNQIVLVQERVCVPTDVNPVGDGNQSHPGPPPTGSAACIGGAIAAGLDPDEYCSADDADEEFQAITGGLVARALRRMALPASDLVIQPPGGRTLVNFETNFFTKNDQPLLRSIQLLGRRIELRIWPESYTWHFGDGEVATTTTPGARFPNLDVTYNYLETGDYQPSVDTTYAAEWRIGDGVWQPVTGTATIAGEPASLQAIEARPTLVGYGG